MSRAIIEDPSWREQASTGESAESLDLAELWHNAFTHLIEPASSTRSRLLAGLAAMQHACANPNWDGYDALPVSDQAAADIQLFLERLPLGIPMPDEVTPEPTGGIGVEWTPSAGRSLIVASQGEGRLSFSLLVKDNQDHGTLPFVSTIPSQILDMITGLYRE